MPLTELTTVTGPGIHTQSNINSHNVNSTGIITAVSFDGALAASNLTGALPAISGENLTYYYRDCGATARFIFKRLYKLFKY